MDGIDEPTYRYVLGRLFIELNKPAEALGHFKALQRRRAELHRYQSALVSLYSSVALRQLGSNHARLAQQEASAALTILKHLQSAHCHFDLSAKVKLARDLQTGSIALSKLPRIDFVTVE